MFNHNLRYFCEKEGLSQQKFADMMGVKRGKVAGYFYETSPKAEFQKRFASKFSIELGRFLTVEMNENNYSSFFTDHPQEDNLSIVAESRGTYRTKSKLIDILMKVKKSENREEINQLLDEAIGLYGKVLDENSELKDINSDLKDQLLQMSKKLAESSR